MSLTFTGQWPLHVISEFTSNNKLGDELLNVIFRVPLPLRNNTNQHVNSEMSISSGSRLPKAVTDPGFPQRGAVNPPGGGGGGLNTQFCRILPKTAWNWKNLDAEGGGGGACVPHAPLRSATVRSSPATFIIISNRPITRQIDVKFESWSNEK